MRGRKRCRERRAVTLLRLHPSTIDYTILAIYFVVVLGIGFVARLAIKTDLDFFLSGRSLPAWITGLAFIAANLGALEILGQAANGAQYGVAAVHYYWLGAVPAMVFLGLVMMPFYYGAKVRSVPEYLRLRFNEATHAFNAGTFALATVLISGVNLFALALIIHLMLGWSVSVAILVAAAMVLIYITLGGLTSAIYNEVLQFFVIVAALLPLTLVALHAVGGINGLKDKVRHFKPLGEAGLHAWRGLGIHHVTNPLASDWVGIVFGLGFVLGFGYWTTNFAEVQRALSARNMSASRRTPLIGAFPKIFLPAIIILPGTDRGRHRQGSRRRQRHRPAIQHGDPAPDRQLPARGNARDRHHRPDRGLHGRRGRQRHRLQHGRHLRPGPVLLRQGPRLGVLPARGPLDHDRRDFDFGGHGVHRQGLLEHHELHPDAVLDLQRPAVRDLHHRDVLAPGHGLGRVLQPRRRNRRRVRDQPPGGYHTIFHFGSALSASFWQAIIAFIVDAVVMVAGLAGHQAEADRGAARARLGADPRRGGGRKHGPA